MCLGNRAHASIAFLNQQYKGLYANAQSCAKKYTSNGVKPGQKEVLYGTCLYEFFRSRKNSTATDHIIFSQAPELHFVCNHEVIIYLRIDKGSFVNNTKEEKLDGATLAFRFTFKTHDINNIKDDWIGAGAYTAIFFILGIQDKSLDLISKLSVFPGISADDITDSKLEAITLFFAEYFTLLKKAGHHVLLSLPDFDDTDSTSAVIDYSIIYKTDKASDFTTSLHGISVDGINDYFKSLWSQAVSHIEENGWESDDRRELSKAYYLARYKDVFPRHGENINFTFTFGPLKLAALCNIEAVLYINLQETVYNIVRRDFGEETSTFTDYKVAFVIDIKQLDEGKIELDVDNARYCEHLSEYNKDAVEEYWTNIVEYIRTVYIHLLFLAGQNILDGRHINSHGDTLPSGPGGDGLDTSDTLGGGEETISVTTTNIKWTEIEQRRITDAQTTPYDSITAITQNSINLSLSASWGVASGRAVGKQDGLSAEAAQAACLAKYSLTKDGVTYFETDLDAPMIQLVIDEQETDIVGKGQVIFYIRLKKGYLKTLGPGKTFVKTDEKFTFENWRVAFTVNLQLQDGRENAKELVLDFSTSKFLQKYSSVRGLFAGDHYGLILKKREALMVYLQENYFPTLAKARYHVLHTVNLNGVKKSVNESIVTTSLTSLTFQIYPFTFPDSTGKGYRDALFGSDKLIGARNSILFLGMTENRTLPKHSFVYRGGASSGNWVVGTEKDIPLGSIAFSRQSFLDARLLKPISVINKNTTIVPFFSGVNSKGEWILKLTTWGEHEIKKDDPTDWKLTSTTDSSLIYSWSNTDSWRYEHKSSEGSDDIYTVECVTENTLTIPTEFKRDTGILNAPIKGNVAINLLYINASDTRSWTSKLTAAWASTVAFSFDSARGGIIVTTLPAKIIPELAEVVPERIGPDRQITLDSDRQISKSVFEQLNQRFSQTIEIKSVIEGLNVSLENISSQLCDKFSQQVAAYPVFNQQGDFLLEIRLRQDGQQTQVTQSGSVSAVIPPIPLRPTNILRPSVGVTKETNIQVQVVGSSQSKIEAFTVKRENARAGKSSLTITDNSKVQNSTTTNGKPATVGTVDLTERPGPAIGIAAPSVSTPPLASVQKA